MTKTTMKTGGSGGGGALVMGNRAKRLMLTITVLTAVTVMPVLMSVLIAPLLMVVRLRMKVPVVIRARKLMTMLLLVLMMRMVTHVEDDGGHAKSGMSRMMVTMINIRCC